MKVEMSWLEGMWALLAFGRIATRQFLNASLLATARLYQTHSKSPTSGPALTATTYLVVTNNKLSNCPHHIIP